MKTKPIVLSVLVFLVGMGNGLAAGATNDVSSLLQKGLFEEEANHNLDAAIAAYQAVVTQTEKDRQFAATAIFRLGECYRKLGRTNEANVQYQRILREFTDQTELVKLSQSYASTAPPAAVTATMVDLQGLQPDPETAELKRIQAMIKDSPDLINGQPGQNNVPLIRAVDLNFLTVARFLLDNKADVNIRSDGSSGSTAINKAAEHGRKEMVELLLDRGADVNDTRSQYSGPHAPIHFAAEHGFKAIAEVLLAHKADVNIKDAKGETPLHLAAKNGFMSVVELLLANGANVTVQNEDGETPLHYAAGADNRNIMELLISHGADVNARARNGTTPLVAAVEASRLNATRYLIDKKADVNVKHTDNRATGWMPLHFAVENGQLELTKLLLENKADVDANVSNFSHRGNLGGGGLPRGPSITYVGVTPLAMAVIIGNKEIAEQLLDHKAQPNATDKNFDTPLSLAVKLNHYDLAELLLSRGAAVTVQNNDHLSPLSLAVNNNAPDIVKLLLAHKPSLEVTDNDFMTPLQRAVVNRLDEIVGLLLVAGANPNVAYERNSGQCPLEWAVQQYELPIVKSLLDHHADPNYQDTAGNTPLSLARQQLANRPDAAGMQKMKDVIESLLKAGANDNLQRLTRISVTRSGMGQDAQVFYKGTNSHNYPTLYETLAAHYCPPWYNPANMSSGFPQPLNNVCGLKFPDFSKIKISRLQPDGRASSFNVNLESALNSGDCAKDIPLEWGDVVEIPESVHNVNETWSGLSDAVAGTLQKCLERKVSVVVRGATNELTLRPNHYVLQKRFVSEAGLTFERSLFDALPTPSSVGGRGTRSTDTSIKTQLPSFWLYDVVHGANVILTSSDLSHVRVKRVNPSTHRADDMTFDLVKNDPNNPLLLHDGDIIELPDKP